MPFRITLLFMLLLASVLGEETRKRGHVIYGKLCAECHGPRGQGVADEYDEPLFGDRTIPDLAKLIHRTMPEDDAALLAGSRILLSALVDFKCDDGGTVVV